MYKTATVHSATYDPFITACHTAAKLTARSATKQVTIILKQEHSTVLVHLDLFYVNFAVQTPAEHFWFFLNFIVAVAEM